jgi:O-antigen/teichoic acid export membrane protein
VRLLATVALAAVGLGATGVAAALSVSIGAAWLTGHRCTRASVTSHQPSPDERAAIRRLVGPTSLLLAGQIVINNADVLIVKAFRPTEAAAYAAVALIGRAVFFCSWSVVTTIFPVAARTGEESASDRRVTLVGAAIVAAAGLGMSAGAALFGEQVLDTVVGQGYGHAAPLLWRYALATTAFTVTNLLATVDLARGILRGPVLVVVGAIAQTAAVLFSTSSLDRVVDAQLTVMALLALAMIADQVRRAGQTAIRYPTPRTVRTRLVSPLRSIFLRRLAT